MERLNGFIDIGKILNIPNGKYLESSETFQKLGFLLIENPTAVIDGIAAAIPMKRLGTIEELGELAAFLASGESSYITGHEFVIDGGSTLPETMTMGV